MQTKLIAALALSLIARGTGTSACNESCSISTSIASNRCGLAKFSEGSFQVVLYNDDFYQTIIEVPDGAFSTSVVSGRNRDVVRIFGDSETFYLAGPSTSFSVSSGIAHTVTLASEKAAIDINDHASKLALQVSNVAAISWAVYGERTRLLEIDGPGIILDSTINIYSEHAQPDLETIESVRALYEKSEYTSVNIYLSGQPNADELRERWISAFDFDVEVSFVNARDT